MSKRKAIQWKGVLIAICGLALFSCAYVLLTLFAIPVSPVEYKAPPTFIQQAESVGTPSAVSSDDHEPTPAASVPASTTDDEIETLAKSALLEGQSPDQFVALFGHPDSGVREAAAHALAQFWSGNMGMTEPRAEGPELMRRFEFMEAFWQRADKPTVLNSLMEVVSKSFETGGDEMHAEASEVLYLMSGFPGLKTQRAEIFAWVANHHPSEHMRRASLFFLVNGDFDRGLGDAVLISRTHDPAVMVRFEAWVQRLQRNPFRN